VDSFPKDALKRRVIRAFESLGFSIVREREHIAMELVKGSLDLEILKVSGATLGDRY
jgi:hypothetical protein